MVELVELGSLYFNGGPVPVGTGYDGEQVTFGDTVPGMGIPFVKWNGIFVADRCVCTNVSWTDLDKLGFIFGYPIMIDGSLYLCRSLKVGTKEGDPNEWDAILDALSEGDDLWHWKNQYFWGQEIPTGEASLRTLRGYNSARLWGFSDATNQYSIFGFRPVLEPLSPEAVISDTMVGSNLKLYGSDCSFIGRLVSYSDYDLELTTAGPLPENCSWIRQIGNFVFIDRSAIIYLHEENGSNFARQHNS